MSDIDVTTLPGFRWMPGMLVREWSPMPMASFSDRTPKPTVRRLAGCASLPYQWEGFAPPELVRTDPTGATCGCLRQLVREAWKDPSIFTSPTRLLRPDGTSPKWFVYTGKGYGPIGTGATEFDALAAALAAAPRGS